MQPGTTVRYTDQTGRELRGRVLGTVVAVGGQEQAHVECLDEDAFANVPVDTLEVLELTAEEVDTAVADREMAMAPKRSRQAIRISRRRLAEAKGKREELATKIAEGEATDQNPALLNIARASLANLDAFIAKTEGEIAEREGSLR